MGNEDDADLAISARHDRAAFAVLYDRYITPVYRYCFRLLGNRQAAEDATGETFAKALAGLNRFDPHAGTGSFRGWLFTIAHHAAMDALRRKPDRPLADGWDVTDPGQLPEEQVVAEETARELHAALATLTDDQRATMHLRLAGLSAPEVAQVLGRTPQAIKSTQFRAISQLRRRLQSSCLPEPPRRDRDTSTREGNRAGHA